MYLSRFGVKDYKCLGEIDIPLTPIHVLIGENDAGKTSLLEAMEAFYESAEKPLQQVFPAPWNGRELVRHGSREPRIELWGKWDVRASDKSTHSAPNFRYGFAVEFPPDGERCSSPGDWTEDVDGREPLRPAGRKEETTIRMLRSGADPSRFGKSKEAVSAVSFAMKGAYRHALNPRVTATPATFSEQRKFKMDPDGYGLATLLDDILSFDPEEFVALRKRFCSLFPQFRSVRLSTEYAVRRRPTPNGLHTSDVAVGKGIYFDSHRGAIRAQHASDGAVLLLAFLAVAHLPEPPSLLLIEEPENGIYPERLEQVVRLLKELVQRSEGKPFPQIMMTTHSPYVLSHFEPEEVTFLSRPPDDPDGAVRARPLRDAPNIKERLADGFYLGELWYNLSEEDLFGER
jgi:hypothetical protein